MSHLLRACLRHDLLNLSVVRCGFFGGGVIEATMTPGISEKVKKHNEREGKKQERSPIENLGRARTHDGR